MSHEFEGTDDQLIASAKALLELDAAGAMYPHGIGGHARTIIEAFVKRFPIYEYDHSVDPSWEDD
jgi:hypothetical protein